MIARRITLVTTFALLATAAAAAPSAAASGVEVESRGSCTRAGQTWQVRLTDNGTQVFAGRQVTRGPSGSFSLAHRIPNQAGPDVIRGRAVNRATGEVCTGSVTLRA